MVVTIAILLTSCAEEYDIRLPVFHVQYQATEGGTIEGVTSQYIISSYDSEAVTARPAEGFKFVEWSDGSEEPTRYEKSVITDFDLTATFEPAEYTITYQVINGRLKGESVQKKKYGEWTDQVVAYSNIDTIYKYTWSDGREEHYRSDLVTGDATYTISFDYNLGSVPSLLIDTGDVPVNSKINYVDAKFSVVGAEDKFNFSSVEGRIRGRGNSTWNCVKKPYRIKFDSKIDLFGLGKAKSWVLLANYQDPAMIRNYGAFDLAKKLGLDYTSESRYIEVYLNQEFLGLYLLTEQVEINENRVLDTKEDVSGATDVPYLIEYDTRANQEGKEGWDWFRWPNRMMFTIKSPDTSEESFTQEQHDFISGYLGEVYSAIAENDGIALEQLLDIESFINFYLVQELYLNSDAGFSSIYLYKDSGGKLTAGPVWDFDRTAGNTVYDYNTLPIKTLHPFYGMLFDIEDFKKRTIQRLQQIKDLAYQNIADTVAIYYEHSDVFDRDSKKWIDVFSNFVPNFGTEITRYKTVAEQVAYFERFMTDRLDWIYSNLVNF